MREATESEALALLDQWAEGATEGLQQQNEEAALSQTQMKRLWRLIDQPTSKTYLDSLSSIPR